MPITAFIGVRISWLMHARNSLLALLSACASTTARSCSSARWRSACTRPARPSESTACCSSIAACSSATSPVPQAVTL